MYVTDILDSQNTTLSALSASTKIKGQVSDNGRAGHSRRGFRHISG